jgi:hypothetical protein
MAVFWEIPIKETVAFIWEKQEQIDISQELNETVWDGRIDQNNRRFH